MGKVFDGATGDAYEKSCIQPISRYKGFDRALLWIKNTHDANSIKFKVIASPGGDDEEELKAETTLAKGESWYDHITQPWESIWFEIKNATAGQNASACAYINLRTV